MPWVRALVALALVLTAAGSTVVPEPAVPAAFDLPGWCALAVEALSGPGLAEVAVQADPEDWQAIFGDRDRATPGATDPGTEAAGREVVRRAGGSALGVWDRAGRPAAATRVIPPTRPTAPAGQPGPPWRFLTPGPVALTVDAQAIAPGVLALRVTPSPTTVRALTACLPAAPDEHFYGLGERAGSLDLAGQVLDNWTRDQALTTDRHTSYAPTPFLLSSRGYGLLLDTTAHATFDLRTVPRGEYCLHVAAAQLRLFLIAGPHPQAVLERHAQLVGRPPLPPRWAFGVWKNAIGGQARVLQEVDRLREAGVPIDAVWIYDAVDERTGLGWPWPVHGPIAPGAYPDLPRLVRLLHAQDLKVLGYLHPFVFAGSAGFDEARRLGLLVQTAEDRPYVERWTFADRGYVDFSSPRATAWWQARTATALTTLGFDGAMLDFGDEAPVQARYANGQPGLLMRNRYPVLYLQAAHAVGQAVKPADVVFLARAGYSGSQRYSTGQFPGDQVRSWDQQRGLPSVVPALLNGGLSGWPYWGPDIGGFLEDGWGEGLTGRLDAGRRRAAEKELWLRWVQLGALSPTMRDMLGWQRDPVGLWTDDETLAAFRAYARLHRALAPYLYDSAVAAHQRGLPLLRPLFLNFPDEPATAALADEYLLGDDLLVAPVLQPGQRQRRVYLPADGWRDYWTGRVYAGPGWVTVAAPRQQIPLFIRAGARLALPPPHELGLGCPGA